MIAARYLSPALHIEEARRPFARRPADVFGKESAKAAGTFKEPILFFMPSLYQRARIRIITCVRLTSVCNVPRL
jgi:hypothetical protein